MTFPFLSLPGRLLPGHGEAFRQGRVLVSCFDRGSRPMKSAEDPGGAEQGMNFVRVSLQVHWVLALFWFVFCAPIFAQGSRKLRARVAQGIGPMVGRAHFEPEFV